MDYKKVYKKGGGGGDVPWAAQGARAARARAAASAPRGRARRRATAPRSASTAAPTFASPAMNVVTFPAIITKILLKKIPCKINKSNCHCP